MGDKSSVSHNFREKGAHVQLDNVRFDFIVNMNCTASFPKLSTGRLRNVKRRDKSMVSHRMAVENNFYHDVASKSVLRVFLHHVIKTGNRKWIEYENLDSISIRPVTLYPLMFLPRSPSLMAEARVYV